MKLVIDEGNTLCKVGIFEKDKLIREEKTVRISIAFIKNIIAREGNIQSAILGTVKQANPAIESFLGNEFYFIRLNHKTPIPLTVNYDTPQSLGADRIAAAVAAYKMYPGNNILVIESGTCITYDFITAEGIYQGGGISPGMHLRFKALHNFTANLPLVEAVKNAALIGKSTEKSIHSGVINGIIAEINGIISMYESNYENLTIILSGGNLQYFDKNLKNNIFAVPNIVLRGLNIILDFNVKK
jgi:type III pantothenate kinase